MGDRRFQFLREREIVGWLEQVAGWNVGVCLPLCDGITFIGRDPARCEFRERQALAGIVEGAQIFLRVRGDRCWVTDATSTNATTLVRQRSAALYLAGRAQAGCEDVVPIGHEGFATGLRDRRWVQVCPGDLLAHPYGCWLVVPTRPQRSASQVS